jgi:hypothetical protein
MVHRTLSAAEQANSAAAAALSDKELRQANITAAIGSSASFGGVPT